MLVGRSCRRALTAHAVQSVDDPVVKDGDGAATERLTVAAMADRYARLQVEGMFGVLFWPDR